MVREYVGTGQVAELAAEIGRSESDRKDAERQALREAIQELTALDAPLIALDEAANLWVRIALLAAGYRQHARGVWRKSRGRNKATE